MKKCVCGRMKDDNALFCPYCGSQEVAEEPAAEPRLAEEPEYAANAQYAYQQPQAAPAPQYNEYAARQEPAFQQVPVKPAKPAKKKQTPPSESIGTKYSAKSIIVLIFGICSLVLGGVIVRLGLGIAGMLMGKKEAEYGQIYAYYGRKLSMIGIIVCIATIALLVIGSLLFSSYINQVLAYILSLLAR